MIPKTNLKTATIYKDTQIKLRFYPVPSMVRAIRVFRHIRYHKDEWLIPLNHINVAKLLEMGFRLSPILQKWYDGSLATSSILSKKKKLFKKLRPFQRIGVNHIEKNNGRALIADDMGLGKTVQSLAWVKASKAYPLLIVCPSSIKENWKREVIKWLKVDSNKVQVISGRQVYPLNGKVVIINYELLFFWYKRIAGFGFQTGIVDEGHKIKNPKAKRTKAFSYINKHLDNLIVLTGTPIENKVADLFHILHAINKSLFPDYWAFVRRYCDAKRTQYGLDVSGSSNVEELHQILTSTIMIRRMKSEVLTELPSKQFNNVYLQLENKNEYDKAAQDLIEFVYTNFEDLYKFPDKMNRAINDFKKEHNIQDEEVSLDAIKNYKIDKITNPMAQGLVLMSLLKQLIIKGKLKQIIEWIKDFLENEQKLVVFVIHREIVMELKKAFPDAVHLFGGMSEKQKQQSIDSFQNGDAKLFIGNMEAAGIGLTLTAASNVVMAEFPDKPSTYSQAIDRVHRMTQTHQVMVWNMVASDTIEEEIIKRLADKQETINNVLSGIKAKNHINIFAELINSYKQLKTGNNEK